MLRRLTVQTVRITLLAHFRCFRLGATLFGHKLTSRLLHFVQVSRQTPTLVRKASLGENESCKHGNLLLPKLLPLELLRVILTISLLDLVLRQERFHGISLTQTKNCLGLQPLSTNMRTQHRLTGMLQIIRRKRRRLNSWPMKSWGYVATNLYSYLDYSSHSLFISSTAAYQSYRIDCPARSYTPYLTFRLLLTTLM